MEKMIMVMENIFTDNRTPVLVWTLWDRFFFRFLSGSKKLLLKVSTKLVKKSMCFDKFDFFSVDDDKIDRFLHKNYFFYEISEIFSFCSDFQLSYSTLWAWEKFDSLKFFCRSWTHLLKKFQSTPLGMLCM